MTDFGIMLRHDIYLIMLRHVLRLVGREMFRTETYVINCSVLSILHIYFIGALMTTASTMLIMTPTVREESIN